jgi:hypothetical protein
MRTPKIEALHRLITWLNLNRNESIPLLGKDESPLKDSPWLSGMLEADGSFYSTWKLNDKGMLIGLVYYIRLTQKQTYTRKLDPSVNVSILPLMEEIADLFKTKVTDIVRDKSYYVEKAFGIRTDTMESRVELFNYLNKYPLFGYKYFYQVNLEKIHKLAISKEYKTIEGRDKVIEYGNLLKYDVNKHTWEHLNEFYKS